MLVYVIFSCIWFVECGEEIFLVYSCKPTFVPSFFHVTVLWEIHSHVTYTPVSEWSWLTPEGPSALVRDVGPWGWSLQELPSPEPKKSLAFWPFAAGRHNGRVRVEAGARRRLQAPPVPHDPQLPAGLRHSALLYDPHRHL